MLVMPNPEKMIFLNGLILNCKKPFFSFSFSLFFFFLFLFFFFFFSFFFFFFSLFFFLFFFSFSFFLSNSFSKRKYGVIVVGSQECHFKHEKYQFFLSLFQSIFTQTFFSFLFFFLSFFLFFIFRKYDSCGESWWALLTEVLGSNYQLVAAHSVFAFSFFFSVFDE